LERNNIHPNNKQKFQFSTDKKHATTQDCHIRQHFDEKQYCRFWILRLVVFTKFPAHRDCLLKLYVLVKSFRTVSRELYMRKRVYIGLTSSLTEGVATVLVFMLFTIGLWHRARFTNHFESVSYFW